MEFTQVPVDGPLMTTLFFAPFLVICLIVGIYGLLYPYLKKSKVVEGEFKPTILMQLTGFAWLSMAFGIPSVCVVVSAYTLITQGNLIGAVGLPLSTIMIIAIAKYFFFDGTTQGAE